MRTTNNSPNFSGKVISVKLENDESSYDFYDSHFEMQGERLFLIGTIPHDSTRSNWSENCTGAIAWECVTAYVVLDSLDAWHKAVKKSQQIEKKVKKSNKKANK